MCSGSGYILKIESSGFRKDGSGCEKRKDVQADSRVFTLSNWKDRDVLH